MAKIHPALARALKLYRAGVPAWIWQDSEKVKWEEEQRENIWAITKKYSESFSFAEWYCVCSVFPQNLAFGKALSQVATKLHEVAFCIALLNNHSDLIRFGRIRVARDEEDLHNKLIRDLMERYRTLLPGNRKEFRSLWLLVSHFSGSGCLAESAWVNRFIEDCGVDAYRYPV